ncbi:MAG: MATE family efflux transporter [Oscillospiraceae bacterium]|nr:MATE family efflux transporter [Oscillospiraceae bacterium]
MSEKARKVVDMTDGSIWRHIVRFALPVLLGNLFQQLYNTFDSIVVGRFAGKESLAAVSGSGNLIFMMTSFFIGLSIGAGVVISHWFGGHDEKRLEAAIHTDVAFGAVCGLVLTAAGICFTPQILTWMRTPADVLPLSTVYFRIYFAGSLAAVLYNTFTGILQAMGDSRSPLRFLVIASLTNVALDLLFVGVFSMGVAGAATATVISQVMSAALCLRRLLRMEGSFRLDLKRVRFDREELRRIVRQGVPTGLQNSIIAIANVTVQSHINTFGSDTMAGYGANAKVEGFVFLPITAFSMAMTTFIGQNLGAGKDQRAKAGARFGILSAMVMAESIGVLVYVLAPYAIRLFNDDPQVVAVGVRGARIESLFYFALAMAHAISAVMRGVGKAGIPMYTMLGCWCVLRVTYITVTLRFVRDVAVIFWAYPLTWTVSCAVFAVCYFRINWQQAARSVSPY